MKIRLPNNWEPRWYQRPFWDYMERGGRRAMVIAHRRWGKDDVALHWAAVSAMQKPATYWHMLPEYAQARKAIWAAINPHTGKRRIDEAFPEALRETTRDNDMFIRFKNGATWQVIGSDNYNSLVGTPPWGIVFSEWALANPTAWSYLAPILRENGGWAAFITTPRGRNHAHGMYEMAKNSSGWLAQVSSIKETGALTEEELVEERREYASLHGQEAADALIEQEYYCSFTAAILGAFWGKDMTQAEQDGRITTVRAIPNQPVHTAWDLGVKDDTAIWFFQINYNKVLVLNYYQSHGHGVGHYAEKKAEIGEQWGYSYENAIDWVPHDAKVREWGNEGKTRIQSMIEHGLNPHVVPDQTVMDGINAGRIVIGQSVFDEKNCKDGIECLRQYQREYDDNLMTFKKSPLHNWASHGADAWRYLSVAHRSEKKPEPKPEGPRDPRGNVIVPKPRPKYMHEMTWDEFEKATDPGRVRERID